MLASFFAVYAVESMTKLIRALSLAMLLTLFGCQASPPVQEMSDARQAIAVARDAGAEQTARDELREAEEFLDSAKRKLADRMYLQARRDALSAKRRALDALAAAEAAGPVPQ